MAPDADNNAANNAGAAGSRPAGVPEPTPPSTSEVEQTKETPAGSAQEPAQQPAPATTPANTTTEPQQTEKKEEGSGTQATAPQQTEKRVESGTAPAQQNPSNNEKGTEAGQKSAATNVRPEDVVKLPTGIPGLDNMLFGGVPEKNQVLVAGGPGAGKTLMCFQILYTSAKAGKQTLFITLEEKVADVIRNAKNAFSDFKDIDELVSKQKLNVIGDELPVPVIGTQEKEELFSSFAKIVNDIENAIKESKATVVVIDSLSLLKLASGEDDVLTYRRALLGLMSILRRLGVTAFLTMELQTPERSNMKFSQEFFVFDGIFVMYQSENQERRTLNIEVVKMRRSNHSLSFAPYEVTEKGFRVFMVDQNERF